MYMYINVMPPTYIMSIYGVYSACFLRVVRREDIERIVMRRRGGRTLCKLDETRRENVEGEP